MELKYLTYIYIWNCCSNFDDFPIHTRAALKLTFFTITYNIYISFYVLQAECIYARSTTFGLSHTIYTKQTFKLTAWYFCERTQNGEPILFIYVCTLKLHEQHVYMFIYSLHNGNRRCGTATAIHILSTY